MPVPAHAFPILTAMAQTTNENGWYYRPHVEKVDLGWVSKYKPCKRTGFISNEGWKNRRRYYISHIKVKK